MQHEATRIHQANWRRSGRLANRSTRAADPASAEDRLAKNSRPAAQPEQLQAFREGMRTLEMIEGRDFVLEERYADGDETRLQSLAAELVGLGVNVILATSQPSIAAAWRVTKSVPVIGRMVDDPVTDGMAQSLARPVM